MTIYTEMHVSLRDKTEDKGVTDIYSLWPIDKNEPMDVFEICQISQRGQS